MTIVLLLAVGLAACPRSPTPPAEPPAPPEAVSPPATPDVPRPTTAAVDPGPPSPAQTAPDEPAFPLDDDLPAEPDPQTIAEAWVAEEAALASEEAESLPPPEGLEFHTPTRPVVVGDRIELTGYLETYTDDELQIAVACDSRIEVEGHSGVCNPLRLVVVPDENVRPREPGPPDEPLPPPPARLRLPSWCVLRYVATLDLATLDYEGAPVARVRWSFLLWNEPRPAGVFELRLPER